MSAGMVPDLHSDFQRASEIKDRHEAELLSKANVIGVGVGLRQEGGLYTQEVALVVMVRRKLPHTEIPQEDLLPVEIEGIPVDVQEIGDLSAQ